MDDPFDILPVGRRDTARTALAEVVGAAPVAAITPVGGGASGASIFRVEAGKRRYLLRMEGPANPLFRLNPYRHACTRLAAEAGIAPALHHLDEADGVMVMDFIEARPLASYPGGPPALAMALGALLRRLQDARPAFPPLVDYRELVAGLLDKVQASGRFAPGLLDPHVERLATIRADCDWNPKTLVSSHNDPNPGNILYDGKRLWLIDWESAYRNDPLVDVSIVIDGLAPEPRLEEVLLHAWLGRAPDAAIHERLAQVRALTRLYYARFLLSAAPVEPDASRDSDLAAPSPEAFGQALRAGLLKPGEPATIRTLGKMFLAAFLSGHPAPGLWAAVASASG